LLKILYIKYILLIYDIVIVSIIIVSIVIYLIGFNNIFNTPALSWVIARSLKG